MHEEALHALPAEGSFFRAPLAPSTCTAACAMTVLHMDPAVELISRYTSTGSMGATIDS
jgi:hypothetical protein